MLTAMGRWVMILAAGCAALLLMVLDVDRQDDSAMAKKGDRLVPLVKVACEHVTMVDTSDGCKDIGPAAGKAAPSSVYVTEAQTIGATTILKRKLVSQ